MNTETCSHGDNDECGVGTVNGFKFELSANVVIVRSQEEGQVRARAEFYTGNRQYLLAMVDAHGAFKEAWIDEDLLEGAVEIMIEDLPPAAGEVVPEAAVEVVPEAAAEDLPPGAVEDPLEGADEVEVE